MRRALALLGCSRLVLLSVPLLSGCFFGDDGLAPPVPRRDATVPPSLGDLAVRDAGKTGCDGACTDLAAPADFSFADASAPVDLVAPQDLVDATPGDAPPCHGGYLNSTDPKACPLSCSPNVEPVPDEGAFHIPFCSPMNYVHNPPASGNHWPWPAPWGIHTGVLPRQWWVHNLEHQGIVLLYNCPYPKSDGGSPPMTPVEGTGGCTDAGTQYVPAVDNCKNEIAQLEQLYNNHPVDNWWDMLFEVRIVVTQDPELPTRFGAVAWDWSYTSNQLDVKALQCFIDARYGRGPEPAP